MKAEQYKIALKKVMKNELEEGEMEDESQGYTENDVPTNVKIMNDFSHLFE